MITSFVTLIQTAERDAGLAQRPHPDRFVAHRSPVVAATLGFAHLLRRSVRQGFRSHDSVSSVSMPGVDFRAGRSSSG
jgi:hypothetical protein